MKHPITDEMLINHIAVLAKTGAGKTYGAKGIVERLLNRSERVCIVDPKNAWWGLKSSADGKMQGFPVVVFGGPNADMPLLSTHGKVLGETIATSDMSCIICTKGMLEGDRIRFLTEFFQALDRKNKEPLHLVLDEAHMMAPQKPFGEMQRLTHWTTELVTGGRGMGFRVMLLSQRPARLNKDVLTQCETLVAMRMTGPQDRDAVRNWIHDQADVNKGKEIVASLTGLANGEGWLWSPEMGVLERIRFPKITTYDNSATKRDATADSRAKLAPVDLKDLETRLGQAAEEIKAHDPKALKARIIELERIANQRAQTISAPDPAALDKEYRRGYDEGAVAINGAWMKWHNDVDKILVAHAGFVEKLGHANGLFPGPPLLPEPLGSSKRPAIKITETTFTTNFSQPPTIHKSVIHEGITRPQQRIIDALAWWQAAGKSAPTRAQVAGVAGYSPSSGGFNNLIGQLNGAGFVSIPAPGTVAITAIGQRAADHQNVPTTADLHSRVERVLSNPQWKVLTAAINKYPNDIAREHLGKATGYSASSGGFNNLIGELCSLDMLEKPKPGYVKAADWLFI